MRRYFANPGLVGRYDGIREAPLGIRADCVRGRVAIVQVVAQHLLVVPARKEVPIPAAPRQRKDVGRVPKKPRMRAVRARLCRARALGVIVKEIAHMDPHVVATARQPLARAPRKGKRINTRVMASHFVQIRKPGSAYRLREDASPRLHRSGATPDGIKHAHVARLVSVLQYRRWIRGGIKRFRDMDNAGGRRCIARRGARALRRPPRRPHGGDEVWRWRRARFKKRKAVRRRECGCAATMSEIRLWERGMGAWTGVVGADLSRHTFFAEMTHALRRCSAHAQAHRDRLSYSTRTIHGSIDAHLYPPRARSSRLALLVPHKAQLPESGGLPFSMSEEYSSVLFVVRECYVYRVPPRTSAAGYRAGEWGDVDQSLWKGRMRIVEYKDRCEIRLEDGETGTSRG